MDCLTLLNLLLFQSAGTIRRELCTYSPVRRASNAAGWRTRCCAVVIQILRWWTERVRISERGEWLGVVLFRGPTIIGILPLSYPASLVIPRSVADWIEELQCAYNLVDAFVVTPPGFLSAIFASGMITVLSDTFDPIHHLRSKEEMRKTEIALTEYCSCT